MVFAKRGKSDEGSLVKYLATVVFNNIKPIAVITGDLSDLVIGGTINLDGISSSDANGDLLSYTWSLVSTPTGSTTSLSNNQGVTTSLTPDVAGPYVVNLVVNDGFIK